jgi:hypothetical protein
MKSIGKTLIALCATALLVTGAWAQAEIQGDDARRDLRILKRALTDLHPGLVRYATPAEIDAEFAAADAAVTPGTSRAEMVLIVSRLAAAVRCGHTWVSPFNQSKVVTQGVFGRADKLPLTLRWIEGRALVTGSTAPGVAAGAELLAIDDRPAAEIAAALLPLLRADGRHAGAEGKRRAQLDSDENGGAMDRLFPLRFPPRGLPGPGRYTLRLRDAAGEREVTVAAVAVAERDRALPPPGAAWSLKVEGDTALMTLPTFAFWRSDFTPVTWLARAFETVRDVPYLIIDQRRNEGGDDAIGRALLAHLLRAPVELPGSAVESAYERVPYVLARHLDTWDFGFFDRTGQVTKGPGRNWRLPDKPPTPVEPVAVPYRGRTLVLVGPQNSSAGFLLARDLQRSGAATLLGQPTGGNLRGLNGGQLAWITLPASGVAVDIPLVAAVYAGDPPDAGITPEVVVAPRFADAQAGIDTELQAARAQVGRWRAAEQAAEQAATQAAAVR